MKYKLAVLLTPILLMAACGAEKKPDNDEGEVTYSCPTREMPDLCSQDAANIQAEDIVGTLYSSKIIQNPDGLYLTFNYSFNSDGTYSLYTEGYSMLTSDCRGYSDGEGRIDETGVYSISGNIITLQPAESNGSQWLISFEPHELRVHSKNDETGALTFSSKEFCSLEFNFIPSM